MIGSTWLRSRIWMIRLDTARVTPAANTTSMTMNNGTHTVATFGARPKMTNRMVSGTQEITVFRPCSSMVSEREALPGELGLGQQRLVG